ncbi:MAG: ChaN family lipoprotein [Taibaiella sp.]|nr:ChaN family lipoprotein [Taibaiella sp.]
MKKILIILLACPLFTFAQEKLSESNYRVYNCNTNKEVSLKTLVADMDNYDVLLFGEEHNDSVTHFVEHAVLEFMHLKFGADVALSLEMFDRDVQTVMDEYLKGYIREKHFKKDARVWSNYRDYRPMVELAKDKKLDVICANAPSRYTNLAGRKGQEALKELSDEAKEFFAPLPYDTASGGYYEKLMGLQHSPSDTGKAMPAMPVAGMGGFNLITAQSLWDATMAYSITRYLKKNKGKKVMHVNGKFHSDQAYAVATQLNNYSSKIKSLIISTASDESFPNINWKEYKKYGDYIIITDPKVPRTYRE